MIGGIVRSLFGRKPPPEPAFWREAPAVGEQPALETVVAKTVVAETVVAETAVAETVVAETVVAETGVAETVVAETVVAETAVAETGVAETGVAETAVAETAVAETAVAETGGAETAVPETALAETAGAETFEIAEPEPVGVVARAVTLPSIAALLEEFETLGENPEMGLLRARLGAGPDGLFGLSTMNPQALSTLLRTRFDRFCARETLKAKRDWGFYYTIETQHNLAWQSPIRVEQMSEADALQSEFLRLAALRARLIAGLEGGSRLFVYAGPLTRGGARLDPRRHGRLWGQHAAARHACGRRASVGACGVAGTGTARRIFDPLWQPARGLDHRRRRLDGSLPHRARALARGSHLVAGLR